MGPKMATVPPFQQPLLQKGQWVRQLHEQQTLQLKVMMGKSTRTLQTAPEPS